jgi:starvation-inducible DNA-binding protein
MGNKLAAIEPSVFDEKTTLDLVALLNQSLADTLDLAFQTKQAYWNVKGYNFHGLHLLFDDLYGQLATHADAFAEQVVTVGGQALGTIRAAGSSSQLAEYPLYALDSKVHVNTLLDRFGDYTGHVRKAVQKAEKLGHQDTAELYTSVTRAMDKALWKLAAHQEA